MLIWLLCSHCFVFYVSRPKTRFMSRISYLLKSALAALMIAALLLPAEAAALNLSDVEGKSDEQLAGENWETREVNANKSTAKCGLWSILVSTVWRGYGHYCIGDEKSHYKLLGMEGVSLLMLATSMIMSSLSKDDKSMSAIWKSLFHYGTTLFIGSYLFDVLGTFKGNSFNLADNHLDPYGHSIDIDLRWLPSNHFNLGVQLAYTYRNPRMWVTPYGYIDIIDLSTYSLGMDTGVALWYGERTHTYVALAADVKFEDYLDEDYRNLKIIPYIEFSLDLGSWFDHLANLRFIHRLGVGVNLYQFEHAATEPFTDHDTLLVLESALSLNIVKDLNFTLTYRYRPDYVVGMLSAPSRLYQTVPVPGVGIFSLDLSFNISSGWQASVEANFGESVDFWIGVNKHF